VANQDVGAKQQRLLELETRMKEQFAKDCPGSHLWFFKDDSGTVAGYLGTEPVAFVGQRPSTGRGGTSKAFVGGFYGRLAEYGFANAHVTDIVKEGMEAGTPSWEQVERNWPYFLEELEIIEPKVLVALGGWVFDTLQQRLNSFMPLVRFTHYSYRFRSKQKREDDLHADFQRLRAMLGEQAALIGIRT